MIFIPGISLIVLLGISAIVWMPRSINSLRVVSKENAT